MATVRRVLWAVLLALMLFVAVTKSSAGPRIDVFQVVSAIGAAFWLGWTRCAVLRDPTRAARRRRTR